MEKIFGNIRDLPVIDLPRCKNTEKKIIFSRNDCWQSHSMRIYQIKKGGNTPVEEHDWPHLVYVTKGKGFVRIGGKEYSIEEGSYFFIPGNTIHNLHNEEEDILEFICIVPSYTEE
jgi:quercetin dioxygenase-like cupin family protein